MNVRHALAALGLIAPACSPAPAHRASAPQTPAASVPPADVAGSAGPGADDDRASSPGPASTTTEAPATTVTVTVPATTSTTRRATTTTFVLLPENAGADQSDVEWLIRQTFPETPDKAVRVARCESELNPAAVNGQHVGIFQVATRVHAALIRSMGYTPADLFDLIPQLAVARAIYDRAGGWGPWTCQ